MTQNGARDDFHEDAIRKIAYTLWESRGAPIGSPDEDWIEAERQWREGGHDLRADGQQPGTNVEEVAAGQCA
jgi:hypothetical protein